ncbi:MAG: hypothetical protein ACYDG5_05500 [Dehalococcoidales bacterium]
MKSGEIPKNKSKIKSQTSKTHIKGKKWKLRAIPMKIGIQINPELAGFRLEFIPILSGPEWFGKRGLVAGAKPLSSLHL